MMSHTQNVRALRQWTQRISVLNVSRRANRQRYHVLQEQRRLNGFLTEAQRQEAIALLVDGIDELPIPTLSALKSGNLFAGY
jgi:hypothetical protein